MRRTNINPAALDGETNSLDTSIDLDELDKSHSSSASLLTSSSPSLPAIVVGGGGIDNADAKTLQIGAPQKRTWTVGLLIALVVLLTFSVTMYVKSLKPFKDEWDMVESFKAVAAQVISSSFCFAFSGAMAFFLRDKLYHRKLWMVCEAIVFGTYALMLMVTDHGGSLQQHGTFNSGASLLLMGLFVTPTVLLWVAFKTIYKSKLKPFALVNSGLLLLIVFILAIMLAHANSIWTHGYNGHVLKSQHDQCSIQTPTFVWEELWPKWIFILKWMTNMPCWEKPGHISTWDKTTGILKMNCPASEESSLLAFPHTEWDGFTHPIWNEFRDHILGRAVEIKPVPAEVNLSWADAVLAQCGKKRDLLVNVFRNESAIKMAVKNGAHSAPPQPSSDPAAKAPLPKLNILVLMVDTLGRNNLRRLLEKTSKTIERLDKDPTFSHKMFQFFRYHTVGFNSNPNWYPLMYNEKNASWSYYLDARSRGYVSFHLWEKCEFVWEWNRGNPDVNPWGPYCLPEYQLQDSESLYLTGPYAIRRRCLTGKYVHDYSFEYLTDFWKTYSDVPKWGFFGTLEGHDPIGNVLGLMDEQLAGILSGKDLDINNTAIFLISDHGWHCSFMFVNKFESGVTENRLPIMLAWLPKNVLAKYPYLGDSLKANEQALFTSADLRQTFTHLLQGHVPHDSPETGYSLLGGAIPDRNCVTAHIPPNICICH